MRTAAGMDASYVIHRYDKATTFAQVVEHLRLGKNSKLSTFNRVINGERDVEAPRRLQSVPIEKNQMRWPTPVVQEMFRHRRRAAMQL
jgi:hypothetical protein